jgi:hypothetical protein
VPDPVKGWESTAAAPLSLPGALTPTSDLPFTAGAVGRGDEARLPASPPAQRPAPPPPAPPPPPPQVQIPVSRYGPDSESLEPSSLDMPFVFRRSEFVDDPDPVPSVLPPAPTDAYTPPREVAPAREVEQVSFVRQARRKAFWRRPFVRFGLALVVLLLATLLVLQAAYQERDRLASLQPQLRPALARMCELLQCTIAAPRQIDAIVIDSSGFNRLRGENYRLSFNVRNTARMRVATPSLELTLTDAQDQPLVRRVLSPAELGGDPSMPPGTDWSGAAGVVVAPGNAGQVAGYRLLAFYP